MSDQPPPPPPSDQYGGWPTAPPPGPYGAAPVASYAHWGKRVGAFLIDGVVSLVASIPFYAGYFWLLSGISTTTDSTGAVTSAEADVSPGAVVLMVVGLVILLAVNIWNVVIRQGRTGYSIGKGVLSIKLIKLDTGQPLGAGMSFVRQLAHILDSLPCYLGYLWPLWDVKRQTFADKVTGSVVVDAPQP